MHHNFMASTIARWCGIVMTGLPVGVIHFCDLRSPHRQFWAVPAFQDEVLDDYRNFSRDRVF